MNLYAEFLQLRPDQPLRVATVIDHNADGTSDVQYLGGQGGTVRGQSVPVGLKAFVRNGVIESETPDVAQVAISI